MRSCVLATGINQLLYELDSPLLSEKGLDMRRATTDEALQVVCSSIALIFFKIDRNVLARSLALASEQDPAAEIEGKCNRRKQL